MRWLTPQELAKASGRAERTIRHYASQGRVKVKKDGKKNWLIEPLSAVAAGIPLSNEFLESLKPTLPEVLVEKEKSSATASTEEDLAANNAESETRKYKSLGKLGVYKDLLQIFRNEKNHLSKSTFDYMKRCLHYIGLGFYEYSRDKKAEYYKQARVFLVSCLVEDDLESLEVSKWREQVENAIIPGVIGLIRKQERRSYYAGTRKTETAGKNG